MRNWAVEVIATRCEWSFRVKNLRELPPGSLNAPGQLVRTIAELREGIGADYNELVEDRSGRSEGGPLTFGPPRPVRSP